MFPKPHINSHIPLEVGTRVIYNFVDGVDKKVAFYGVKEINCARDTSRHMIVERLKQHFYQYDLLNGHSGYVRAELIVMNTDYLEF